MESIIKQLVKPTKVDLCWIHILKNIHFDIHQHNTQITATRIKECRSSWNGPASQFEPRILCKQDSSERRPEIFKLLGINIIAIKNGLYLLTKSDIYKTLDCSNIDMHFTLRKDQTSQVLSIGQSETTMLDNLRYSGVFELPHILGEPITHGPLLGGRHRCTFDTIINGENIPISGVQYETDAVYETENQILIIEAKCGAKPCASFNIRQLYFPYRVVLDASVGKDIIALFIDCVRGRDGKKVIHMFKFIWEDSNEFDSIKQIGYYTCSFE